MSISTERGDRGKSYWNGREVDKDSPLLEAIGMIDELQSRLGLTKILVEGEDKSKFNQMEMDLYSIMGNLSCGQEWNDGEKRVLELKSEVERMEADLPINRSFTIPGENEIEANINSCRTACRTAERRVVTLNKEVELNENVLKYFNRLSDVLYLMAIEQVKN